ncbi:hypothetical protein AX16_003058 [Volvariella volvacea WC 439]|nr:hypothetical protein AX16_003058 [Volvariella volvacea WC 439]
MKTCSRNWHNHQPEVAAPYFAELIDNEAEAFESGAPEYQLWHHKPTLFSDYGEALLYIELEEAKIAMEKSFEGMDFPNSPFHKKGAKLLFTVRCNLALVLDKLQVEEEAREDHINWAVEVVKKNPDYIEHLGSVFFKSEVDTHPVLREDIVQVVMLVNLI